MRIISAMASNLGSAVAFDAGRAQGTRATVRFPV
jgi:hypothetical protein